MTMPIEPRTRRAFLLGLGATVAAAAATGVYKYGNPLNLFKTPDQSRKLYYGPLPGIKIDGSDIEARYTHKQSQNYDRDLGLLEVFEQGTGNKLREYTDRHIGETLEQLTLDEERVFEGSNVHSFRKVIKATDSGVGFVSAVAENLEYSRTTSSGKDIYRGDSHDQVERAVVDEAVRKFGIEQANYTKLIAAVKTQVKRMVAPNVMPLP